MDRPWYYILDGHTPIPVDNIEEWSRWMQENKYDHDRCHVGDTRLKTCWVSTVFLGMDHGFSGPPVLFETMIFGGPHDQYQERYVTWEEAEAGHQHAVALAEVWDEVEDELHSGNGDAGVRGEEH